MKITSTSIEVRYAETDKMGVVHHSNYLVYCEIGRTELIKELGFNYAELERDGILSPVINVNLNYKLSVTYGDTVTMKTWVEDYDGLRIIYGYELLNESGQSCMAGYTEHVCVKKETFRPVSIRKHLPDWHEVYEREKKGSTLQA